MHQIVINVIKSCKHKDFSVLHKTGVADTWFLTFVIVTMGSLFFCVQQK